MGKTWDKIGAMWCHEKEPDGAGNTPQYLLGSIEAGGRIIKFAAHPNLAKTDDTQPDFLIFVKPQAK